MNQAKFKKKLMINIIIAGSLIIVLMVLLILAAQDIKRRVAQIDSLRQELASRANALQSLATLKQDYEKAKPYSARLQTLLPTKDEVVNFPQNLNNIARTNKVELGFSFGAEKSASSGEPASIAFSLTSSSLYSDFLNFLKAVEGSRYFIKWESIDISRAEEQTQKFSALVSGRVYINENQK